MTVNGIFPNILDVLYKQFNFSIKKTDKTQPDIGRKSPAI